MTGKFDKLLPGLHNKLHLVADLMLLTMSVLLTVQVNGQRGALAALLLLPVAMGTWLLTSAVLRIYSPLTPRRLWDSLTLRGIGVASVLLGVGLAASLHPQLGRHIEWEALGILFFCSGSLSRALVFKPLARVGKAQHDVLIVGTGHLGVATYERLRNADLDQRCNVVGFLALNNQPTSLAGLAAPVLGHAEQVLEVLSSHPVSEVYLAGRVLEHGLQMQELVTACEMVGMPFAVPLHALTFERARLQSSSPARDGYLHYMSTSWKPMQYAVKRLVDILASAVALLILSPLLITTAFLIKVSSPGPIFFRQRRVGLHGTHFDMLKFRSMVVDAERIGETLQAKNEQTGPVFKMKNDPRITGIGRFIRKYSIDELPQLINILRGEMATVGPRPALMKEVVQYKSWQRRRLSVRPGLTCYWQVGGRNSIGFDDWMRLDLRYVDNWSLGVDVSLILQTFPAVLAGRGAS